ncbi:MAG TPA: hypothetical protein VMU69_14455 [Bradyrhizobium sp.]|nr:hypothetical protein [Bradyrhizobium sp.]
MRSKLALSVLVAASLAGATTIASAQTQPAPGMSREGTSTHMKSTKSSKMKSNTTTGMSRGMSHNPSSKGNVGPGTEHNSAPASGSKY